MESPASSGYVPYTQHSAKELLFTRCRYMQPSSDAEGATVQCYAIFLASIGDEADRIRAALPRGKAFTCLDTAALPGLFRSIFVAEFGNDFV